MRPRGHPPALARRTAGPGRTADGRLSTPGRITPGRSLSDRHVRRGIVLVANAVRVMVLAALVARRHP
ncbi:hypothetical protein ACWDR9_24720, partial [Streptosporangium sandarakinum]